MEPFKSTRPPVVEIIDPMVAAILRTKTPAERLAQASDLYDFAIEVMRASISHDHPEWAETEIRREITRRLHGSVVE